MSDQEFTPPVIPDPPSFGSAEDRPEPVEGPPSLGAAAPVPPAEPGESGWVRAGHEIVAALKTLVSAAVYATLIVTFGFQVARVDGLSMAPTLEDHDRLIVNKLVYELGEPRPATS